MKNVRIAIYGDVNLNIIDGSSVWVSNVAKLSAATPDTDVVVYSKAPVYRPKLVQALLDLPNVSIVGPKGDEHSPALPLPKMTDNILKDHAVDPFDVVIVRGRAAAESFAAKELFNGKLWIYLTDIPQTSALADADACMQLQKLAEKCRYLLCQTEELRNFLETRCEVSGRKLLLLPPIVPDSAFTAVPTSRSSDNSPLRLVYSGKFAPLWGLDEQLDAFETLRSEGHAVEFNIVGDKFHHDPANAAFAADLKERFLTPGVIWHGGLEQAGVFEVQERCHVGMALRSPEMNNSLELSTKLLEYGASGLAALANPTLMHRRALGEDYPLFAANAEEAADRLRRIIENPAILERAASRLRQLAESHRMSAFQATWNRYLARMAHPASLQTKNKRRVVLAGHDLKFCKELIEYLRSRKDVELRIDKWESLRDHDEAHSRRLVEWADTVICEWCAGNAVWYSKNVKPDQQLFVRFHRFEINTEFPAKLRMESIRRIIFVGQHILDDAATKFAWNKDQLAVVPNFVDTLVYDRPKLEGSRFNLGFIGYVPMLKRLDRAIDILEELLKSDDRYALFVKGRHPWEYPWIWRNDNEKAHYEEIFRRLRETPGLRDHVVFDGFGDDIPSWLRKIGFILSTSDLESFHMAAAEGMASGAQAVFMEREGVREIFPSLPVFDSAGEAAEFILTSSSSEQINKKYMEERYSFEKVSSMLHSLLAW